MKKAFILDHRKEEPVNIMAFQFRLQKTSETSIKKLNKSHISQGLANTIQILSIPNLVLSSQRVSVLRLVNKRFPSGI